jgi:hypothetical protein
MYLNLTLVREAPLKIDRCICEGNIKMDIQEVGCGGMYRIDLVQDMDSWRAVLNVGRKIRVP